MKLFFAFLILFPIESFSNSCQKVFETPSLSDKQYTLTALREAINSLSYEDIISNYPSLSLKDEQALFKNFYDKRAFQILFLSNVYIIPYMSKKWMRIINKEGLYLSQKGVTTLLSALRNYDYKQEIRFVTYLSKEYYMEWPKKVIVKTDGASRKNPGPSALGLVVLDSNKNLIYADSSYLGDHKTNNFANYEAVIRALELAVQNKVQELALFADSEIVINQLQGKWSVNSERLKALFQSAQSLLKQIPKSDLQHIPRGQNKEADALANQALDREF